MSWLCQSRSVIKTLTGQHLNVCCASSGSVHDLKDAVATQAVSPPSPHRGCRVTPPSPPSPAREQKTSASTERNPSPAAELLAVEQGWGVDQQRLIFGGKQLDDGSPLAQYGIANLSILYVPRAYRSPAEHVALRTDSRRSER